MPECPANRLGYALYDRRLVIMGKILFVALIAVIAWLLFFVKRKPAVRAEQRPSAEAMVVCARCGVHLPASESARIDGLTSCRDPAHCDNNPEAARR